jgi:hypothetical protein
MNRKNLTSAVLAGLAGVAGIASTAQAVNINPDGLGQVLIYPYYTTAGDNFTLLSVVNTTGDAKAVKVRFLEGENSQEVLDFNLYMSPYDVWTAELTMIPNPDTTFDPAPMVPGLITGDTSCTVPYIYEDSPSGQPFLPFRLTDKGQADPDIAAEFGRFESTFPRALEGHVEMLEMGVLTDDVEGSATAATHDSTGVPADCDQLVEAWFEPAVGNPVLPEYYWTADEEVDIDPPTGGLFGGGALVNVGRGTLYTYNATAINGWSSSGFDPVTQISLHSSPGDLEPGLDSGDNFTANVFLDDGTALPIPAASSVDAVSLLFQYAEVLNEYVLDGISAERTEWVMTFPTKRSYVFNTPGGLPVVPFTDTWSPQEDLNDNGDFDPEDFWGACEAVLLDGIYDREEQLQVPDPDEDSPPIVSPRPPGIDPEVPVFELCFETSVVEFIGGQEPDANGNPVGYVPADGDPSAILGSTKVSRANAWFEAGWARVNLWMYPDSDPASPTFGDMIEREPLNGLLGLPVTGFSVNQYSNGELAGDAGPVLANYGGIFTHRATRLQSTAPTAPTQ